MDEWMNQAPTEHGLLTKYLMFYWTTIIISKHFEFEDKWKLVFMK